MRYVIDRIENNIAVCENSDRIMEKFNLNDLFCGAKEGDWFEFINGKCVFLKEETISARNKNTFLQNNLFEEE